MKHWITILFLSCALGAGASAQAGKAAEKKPARKAEAKAKPAPVTPPADAERISEGVWRAKDAQGKSWIYKRTPFGMTKYEEESAATPAPDARAPLRVREAAGGRVVFERQTPFGTRSWSKSAAELDEEERQALEAWQKAAGK